MKVKCPSFSLLRCRVGLRIGVKRRVWREKGVNKMPCDAISKASVRLVGAGVALEGHEGRCEGALREARGAAWVRGGRRRVGVGWRRRCGGRSGEPRWVQRARGSGSGARGARHRQHTSGSIANTFLTQSQTHPRDKRAPPYLSTLAPLS